MGWFLWASDVIIMAEVHSRAVTYQEAREVVVIGTVFLLVFVFVFDNSSWIEIAQAYKNQSLL